MSEKDCRYVIRNIVKGLECLSQMDIIHRDIKLDNIMVNNKNMNHCSDIENFEFKIGDMGLAKPLSFNQELT